MIRHREADQFAFEQACQPRKNEERDSRFSRSLRKLYSALPYKVRRVSSPFVGMVRAFGRRIEEIIKNASRIPRVAKILILKMRYRSDYSRWTDSRSLETWWGTRTEKMAQFIPKNTRVIEFGAGYRQLEKYLDKSCSYVPSDLVDRGPDTIICDLNQRPLPDLRHLGTDVAFFAGVLEYIRDVGSLIEWLSEQVSFCVASYTCVSPTLSTVQRLHEKLGRLYYGYMNDYTEEELLGLFKRSGFVLTAEDNWTSQRIFVLRNQRAKSSSNARNSF
jgi:hypothetical protein